MKFRIVAKHTTHRTNEEERRVEMASHGKRKTDVSGDQEERKNTTVSFGFTKTVSKFKSSNGDTLTNNDKKEYLTGIDQNKLQR